MSEDNERKIPKRLLILCVDRDDDIGEYTRVETPIVGRDAVLKSAIKFAIQRPEDSDSNALFAAIQQFDRIRKVVGPENCEIAVIAGTPEEGIEADMKILSELDKVLGKFSAEAVVLISDGPTDEQVIPLIQSRLPVISVRRVVVQQSRGIEESFVLVTGYLKKLFTEPKYRKYSLGIPGILMFIQAFLSVLGISSYFWHIIPMFLGLAFVYKGFALDEKIKEAYSQYPITFISMLTGITLILTGTIITYSLGKFSRTNIIELISEIMLTSIGGLLTLADITILGVLFILAGRIADNIIQYKRLDWKSLIVLSFIIPFREATIEIFRVILGMGNILYLIYWMFISVLISMLVAGFLALREKITILT